jgi:hypothetical protein
MSWAVKLMYPDESELSHRKRGRKDEWERARGSIR